MPKVPRLTVSTTQESAALSIPHDILVKIVYFVQEWSSVASLLEALRPAKVLGPLEHLWHLHFVLKWHGEDLWPRLDLTKLDTDSCTHLEGIVKYHAQVAVNSKTYVAWFHQHGHPLASIRWMGPTDSLSLWTEFRVTSLENQLDYDQLIEVFQLVSHLEMIDWVNSNPRISAAIFKFAASSSNLRHLELTSQQDLGDDPSPWRGNAKITASMCQDIITWARSCPIQVFRMSCFDWESSSLRNEVLRAILNNPTLKVLDFFTFDKLHPCEAEYDRCKESLMLTYRNLYPGDNGLADSVEDYFGFFQAFLATEIREFYLVLLDEDSFPKMWLFLAPLLQKTRIRTLTVNPSYHNSYFDTMLESTHVAQTISKMSTLEKLEFDKDFVFRLDEAKAIVAAAPPSLRTLNILTDSICMKELQKLAQERQVQLNAKD
ncbi:hypothetical protein AeMF1_021385 [Aphanomyces euteiches]|nr:hypothetical protein AeMF1_021385 [Aphanomyces euteiches]KAH9185658.1 hypothetical protein AeNC1_012367 [Aphanomyces euteiches]